MLDLGLLAFTQPWLLTALLTLPALWLLLRLTPPAPRRVPFAGLFLLRLQAPEETPARTPWWLLLLRLTIAALLILALAGPLLNPAPRLAGSGPLLLVLDDGWAAAPSWQRRIDSARDLLQQAEREGREVVLLRTAPDRDGVRLERASALAVLEALPGWQPRPWPVDRAAASAALAAAELDEASVVWLSDGLATSPETAAAAGGLAEALARLGTVRILTDGPAEHPLLLAPPTPRDDGLEIRVTRAGAEGPPQVTVRAVAAGGEVLARTDLTFGADDLATGALTLPLELRNRIARLELTPLLSIGGTVLFDERWRRRTVGLYGAHHAAASQPLLGDLYFIHRALAPFAEIREGAVPELLDGPLSMIVIADVGTLGPGERVALERWIEGGGVVLRFAGPRLAAAEDDFVPVRLRRGDRQLGGALSWSEPLPLAPFDPRGPFAGLTPSAEARVSRQVLAEPGPELARAVLASLADGTPIVTGRAIGDGWLILVHTTANTAWSSLPLSGLFVDMLRRVMALGPGVGGQIEGAVAADAVLDAFGRLQRPPADLLPIDGADLDAALPSPATPPGLYARLGAGDEAAAAGRLALNLQRAVNALLPLDSATLGRATEPYRAVAEVDLAGWLLLAALLLLIADMLVALAVRGLLPAVRPATVGLVLVLALPGGAWGQQADDEHIRDLTQSTRFGYVRTGIAAVDETSRAGLAGLGAVLEQRTSIETREPVAVDPAADDLALFPLLYWPVPPEHPDLPEAARDRLRDYLRSGGMILFDTLDAGLLLPGQAGGGPGERRLAALLAGIELPPLVPLPADHVLTRSFYLLQDFPGRFAGQPLWVEDAPASVNDGVAGIVIGANDWAGAWAIDEAGRALFPVDPGGEQQRETARRFGVNLAMYALTGNYKTDQVHVPALLERLGQ